MRDLLFHLIIFLVQLKVLKEEYKIANSLGTLQRQYAQNVLLVLRSLMMGHLVSITMMKTQYLIAFNTKTNPKQHVKTV